MADRVADRDLPVAAQHGCEGLVGRRERDDREVVAVLAEPRERGADAELDAAHGIGFVADRLLLALAEVVVRRLQQLREELFLRREVPVEDALADAERLDDVGDGGRVVAALGEEPGRAGDQLFTALPAALRELPAHPVHATRRLDRSVNTRTARRRLFTRSSKRHSFVDCL